MTYKAQFFVVLQLLLISFVFASETGIVRFTDASGADLLTYNEGDLLYVEVTDSDQNADSGSVESITLTVLSETETDGESLSLTETDVSSGVFTGSMSFEENSPSGGDGLLQVSRGDQLTASYDDPQNGFGNPETVEAYSYYGVSLKSGTLAEDEIWDTDGSPYLITGDVTVSSGQSLTIEPGVEVRFTPLSDDQGSGQDINRGELRVYGSLTAEGTESDSITFTSNSTSPSSGDWYGIYLRDSNSHGSFAYNKNEYTTYGIKSENQFGSNSDTTRIVHSLFQHTGVAVWASYSHRTLLIEDNTIINTSDYAIYIRYSWGADNSIIKRNILETHGTGIYLTYGGIGTVSENIISGLNGSSGIYIQYITELILDGNSVQNFNTGMYINDSDNYGVSSYEIFNNEITNNSYGAQMFYVNANIENNTISDNNYDGLYLSTDFTRPRVVTIQYNSIINNGDEGIDVYEYLSPVVQYNDLYGNSGYDYRNNSTTGNELDARYNFWGDATTDEMDEGGNPKNIAKIYDYYDDNSRGFVNYANWLDSEILTDDEVSGCTDESACNYNSEATVDDDSCSYAQENYDCDGNCIVDMDCNDECGGSAELDNCDVCGGDNTSCLTTSSEMAAYYFSSISLDGTPLTLEDEIIAKNESSGRVVGYGTYQNVEDGYTEVIVYGEMSIENSDSTFNTDGYMLPGDTPQFYINDLKVEYIAADGTLLHAIPPFQSPSIFPNLTMDLVTDCNGDMGGAASIDYCAECYGGQTGLNEGWNDTDGDSVCDPGAENGDADNCIDIANTDQWNYDGDEEGDACDDDDDNDAAPDDLDTDDNNEFVCNDDDGDNCDECSLGSYDSANDGDDYDMDGACNDGDDDDDNDTVLDADDSDPLNEFACQDADIDNCDDCSQEGVVNTLNDGTDNDEDGWCNDGDQWPDCPNDPIDADPYDECGNCNGDGFVDVCVGTDDCNDMACDGDCDQVAYIDDCGECDDSENTDCIDLILELHDGPNLISFYALAEDVSVETIFGDADGVLTEGAAAFNNDGNWIGSLSEVSQDDGYWVIVSGADSLTILDADPINYDADGEVEYNMHYGPNLISYPFQTPQYLDDALGDASDNIYALFGEGMATLNCANNPCDDGWVGSMETFEGGRGYWLLALDAFDFSFEGTDEGLSRMAVQTPVRAVPESYSFTQTSNQAFFFIESATIENKQLDSEDIIIAYNGDQIVGSRYWNGQFTDVPAMGFEEFSSNEGYCKDGDRIHFKVWDSSESELTYMEAGEDIVWQNLNVSVINLTEILPDQFSLESAYPNPFNPITTLSFSLPIESEVNITVYNLQGKEVVSLLDKNMNAGYHSAKWNANSHSSGVYFVKMVAGEYVSTQKLMLVK